MLGILGALVGGFLAGALLGVRDPLQGPLDLTTIVVSVAGAVVLMVAVRALNGPRRIGRWPI